MSSAGRQPRLPAEMKPSADAIVAPAPHHRSRPEKDVFRHANQRVEAGATCENLR
jgi:hypothetical protein